MPQDSGSDPSALEREIARARYEVLREYAELLEHAGDWVLAVAPDGTVASANRRAAEIAGRPREALLGARFADLVPEEALAEIRARRGVREEGEVERCHLEIDAPRGERRSVSLAIRRRPDGSRIVALRDNTAEKRLEARLTEANARLRRLGEMKNAFLAAAAHELKTPLGVALGYLRLLEDGRLGPLGEDQADAVRDARACLAELRTVVGDLLDLARAEAGRMPIRAEPGDLAEAARRAASRFRLQAEAAGVAIEVDAPEAVPARFDAGRIGQVLANLLANALKFTPRGGRVRVRAAREGEGAVLEVSDDGPGIPEDRLEEAFEEFARLGRGGADDPEGAGLGLAVVRRIAEAHGGAASAHRAPEGGALLRVRLPGPSAARAAA